MNSKQKQKHVLVVGAGPGGLATAMILAHRGFRVTVVEKEANVGGRSGEIRMGDYRFDIGPTFLMMKYVLDELFEQAGCRTEDYLSCPRLDPMYRLDFGNKALTAYADREKMKAEIEKVFPGQGKQLDTFYRRESERFKFLYPCLQRDYGSLSSFFSLDLLKAVPHVAAGRSLYDVLSDYFEPEELRLAFTFQSKYLGMSPWDCPGLFAMIPFTEHAHGVFHVMGGLSQITEAFAKVAKEKGATIRTSSGVKQLLVEKGRVVGAQLENGETIHCDESVINADFSWAAENLFAPGVLKKYTPEKLRELKYSCSTFMIYLGLDKIYDTDHHSIYFAKDYKQNLEDISIHHRLSDDFSFYIRNASKTDPSLAPAGHSALYILVPVPNQRSGVDWQKEAPIFREKIFRAIEERTPFKGFRDHIRAESIISPLDWQKKLSVYEGATFNLGHGLSQMLYLRPRNKFEEVDNCYLVGGGTHPGSGLPTIFESARISANLLSKKYEVEYPAPLPFSEHQAAYERAAE